jgi:hypothetical protein
MRNTMATGVRGVLHTSCFLQEQIELDRAMVLLHEAGSLFCGFRLYHVFRNLWGLILGGDITFTYFCPPPEKKQSRG